MSAHACRCMLIGMCVQLEELRGEAAAMRQQMAAALPQPTAGSLPRQGGRHVAGRLFSSRRHSMLNLGTLAATHDGSNASSALSPRTRSVT